MEQLVGVSLAWPDDGATVSTVQAKQQFLQPVSRQAASRYLNIFKHLFIKCVRAAISKFRPYTINLRLDLNHVISRYL